MALTEFARDWNHSNLFPVSPTSLMPPFPFYDSSITPKFYEPYPAERLYPSKTISPLRSPFFRSAPDPFVDRNATLVSLTETSYPTYPTWFTRRRWVGYLLRAVFSYAFISLGTITLILGAIYLYNADLQCAWYKKMEDNITVPNSHDYLVAPPLPIVSSIPSVQLISLIPQYTHAFTPEPSVPTSNSSSS
ncbi:hypothetical protein BDP27DRAFT_1428398 [Rhodocollybia butyracea]|uniref:Uncharacterized protein n=1 Tax=Rhodocollybia butyracea TaxID=206335 RepID=A0A9P5PEQ9_9AGAR|nr:hypothetical protein BDP27DRAFT_1428398 [Rhodocollybia butyracea]